MNLSFGDANPLKMALLELQPKVKNAVDLIPGQITTIIELLNTIKNNVDGYKSEFGENLEDILVINSTSELKLLEDKRKVIKIMIGRIMGNMEKMTAADSEVGKAIGPVMHELESKGMASSGMASKGGKRRTHRKRTHRKRKHTRRH